MTGSRFWDGGIGLWMVGLGTPTGDLWGGFWASRKDWGQPTAGRGGTGAVLVTVLRKPPALPFTEKEPRMDANRREYVPEIRVHSRFFLPRI